jgi:hypothetical protein
VKPINARGLVMAVLLSTGVFGGAAHVAVAAQADDGSDLYVRRRPPTVPPDPGDPADVASNADTRVLGRTVSRSAGTGSAPMPITGGDVAGLTAIGLGAVGVGTVLVRRGRRIT